MGSGSLSDCSIAPFLSAPPVSLLSALASPCPSVFCSSLPCLWLLLSCCGMLWKRILALCLHALHVFPLFGHCEVAVAPWQWTGTSMEQHHVSPPGPVSCGQVLQWFWWFHSCGCLEMSDTRS